MQKLLSQSCIEQMREPDTCFLQLLPHDRGVRVNLGRVDLHLSHRLFAGCALSNAVLRLRSLDDLDVPQSVEAVRYATARGWILVESGNSVCLTDAGWRLTELL